MKFLSKILQQFLWITLVILFAFINLNAARIQDIADIKGVGEIQVIGYGLVTGLNNTGDNQQASFTVQSVSNMLKRFGLTIPQTNPRVRNVAAVMVTASIPKFLKTGSKVDVQVSSIGDATSLQGGVLIMSPMSTTNGEIVGFAQGPLSVGGYDFQSLGSRVARNFVTTGRIPNGLILEKDIDGSYLQGQIINIILREPNFTTAFNIANAINSLSGLTNSAVALDAGTVQVTFPNTDQMEIMKHIAAIQNTEVEKNIPAKVVINERTGTIVVGGNVQLLPAVISHGGLEITIQRRAVFSQPTAYPTLPYPYAIGDIGDYNSVKVYYPPQKDEEAEIGVKEEINPANPIPNTIATVADMANALNALKVKPRDLIAIFQALKEAGVLQAELVIQ